MNWGDGGGGEEVVGRDGEGSVSSQFSPLFIPLAERVLESNTGVLTLSNKVEGEDKRENSCSVTTSQNSS